MRRFNVELVVTPRPGVRDPQGEAVEEVLRNLGHTAVAVGCVGRVLRMTVEAEGGEAARGLVNRLCDELLVNPSLETFQARIEEA